MNMGNHRARKVDEAETRAELKGEAVVQEGLNKVVVQRGVGRRLFQEPPVRDLDEICPAARAIVVEPIVGRRVYGVLACKT